MDINPKLNIMKDKLGKEVYIHDVLLVPCGAQLYFVKLHHQSSGDMSNIIGYSIDPIKNKLNKHFMFILTKERISRTLKTKLEHYGTNE
tara:strand:+ start:322 stop:588 length:267 start_codon:yes stop_codon:yes gene_type:complete